MGNFFDDYCDKNFKNEDYFFFIEDYEKYKQLGIHDENSLLREHTRLFIHTFELPKSQFPDWIEKLAMKSYKFFADKYIHEHF